MRLCVCLSVCMYACVYVGEPVCMRVSVRMYLPSSDDHDTHPHPCVCRSRSRSDVRRCCCCCCLDQEPSDVVESKPLASESRLSCSHCAQMRDAGRYCVDLSVQLFVFDTRRKNAPKFYWLIDNGLRQQCASNRCRVTAALMPHF